MQRTCPGAGGQPESTAGEERSRPPCPAPLQALPFSRLPLPSRRASAGWAVRGRGEQRMVQVAQAKGGGGLGVTAPAQEPLACCLAAWMERASLHRSRPRLPSGIDGELHPAGQLRAGAPEWTGEDETAPAPIPSHGRTPGCLSPNPRELRGRRGHLGKGGRRRRAPRCLPSPLQLL